MAIKEFQSEIEEIQKFAQQNDNEIASFVFEDIIKQKHGNVNEEILKELYGYIREKGINILPDMCDDYQNVFSDPQKFIPSDVKIGQSTLNVSNLMERLSNDEFDLAPEFQRKNELWDYGKQSRLIESLMLKIPLPAFYFDGSSEDKWIVIDGLQRLSAFLNYLVGTIDENGKRVKKSFEGLQYLTDFNGKCFDDLPRQYIRRIKESSIIAFIVEKGTPTEVVYNIFQRINTGGVTLEAQEIRHALYQGKGTKLLIKLADTKEFLRATQNAIPTDRMLDCEFVLRYIAFTRFDYENEYQGNIDNYLITALNRLNNMSDDNLVIIEQDFIKDMDNCNNIFGKYAFRKVNPEKKRGPINKAIFELWSVCIHCLSQNEIDKIFQRKEVVLEKYIKLLLDKDYSSAIKAGDKYSVIRRIDMTKKMLESFI